MTEPQPDQEVESVRADGGRPTDGPYVHRILLTYALAAVFVVVGVLLWYASNVLMLIFSGILLAVLFSSAATWLSQWSHLPRWLALGLVLFFVIALIACAVWLLAPRINEQGPQLMESLSRAVDRVREFLSNNLPKGVVEAVPGAGGGSASGPEGDTALIGTLLSRARDVVTGVFGVVANTVIVLFISVYLAAQPHVYINGFVKLFPKRRRERVCEVLHTTGDMLGRWLLGQLMLMLIVGTLTAVSLLLLGVPLALVIGLIAGAFEFIPYLGPILAGVLAVLVAFSQDTTLALYVLVVFVGIQVIEGNILQPLIARRMVSLPPALTISVQVMFALPFGLLGLALATPLAATAATFISMLYVQDVLEDPVKPPGIH